MSTMAREQTVARVESGTGSVTVPEEALGCRQSNRSQQRIPTARRSPFFRQSRFRGSLDLGRCWLFWPTSWWGRFYWRVRGAASSHQAACGRTEKVASGAAHSITYQTRTIAAVRPRLPHSLLHCAVRLKQPTSAMGGKRTSVRRRPGPALTAVADRQSRILSRSSARSRRRDGRGRNV